jgi:hypothetical protein
MSRPFDFGSGLVSSSGGPDAYLARFDLDGLLARDAFVFGDPAGKEQSCQGVAVAARGNVGIIGRFTGEIRFTPHSPDHPGEGAGSGAAGLDVLRAAGSTSFYGIFAGGSRGAFPTPIRTHAVHTGSGSLMAIGSHPKQNAFVICGKTDQAVPSWSPHGQPRGATTGPRAVAGGGMDVFVAKVDAATGDVLWGRQFGGEGDQVCEAATLDGKGDVVIAGWYGGTLLFDHASLPARPLTEALLYVARLDGASGRGVAATTWGKGGRSNAHSVVTDAADHIIVGGTLGTSLDLGSGLRLVNQGWTDAFVVKLTPLLSPTWARAFGDADFDQSVKAVAVTGTGDVIIAGSFAGSLGDLKLTSANRGVADAFMAKLAGANGATLAARAYGDAAGAQAIGALAVPTSGKVGAADVAVVAGSFTSTIAFGTTFLRAGDVGALASFVARVQP